MPFQNGTVEINPFISRKMIKQGSIPFIVPLAADQVPK